MRLILLFVGIHLFCASAMAGVCSATATQPVALLELYTSEGCSSCPPADKWLDSLAHSSSVPSKVVPLALHVPYWDYIGWKDRFAFAEFEQRQRTAVMQGRSRAVYTPQVLLNGRDLTDWNAGGLERALQQIAQRPARASLQLSAHTQANITEVSLTGTAPAGAALFLARYENGLVSDVRKGENAGVVLKHDQVVRDWVPLGSVPRDRHIAITRSLPSRKDIQSGRDGLVAFVEDSSSGEILQAVLLPHCTDG